MNHTCEPLTKKRKITHETTSCNFNPDNSQDALLCINSNVEKTNEMLYRTNQLLERLIRLLENKIETTNWQDYYIN